MKKRMTRILAFVLFVVAALSWTPGTEDPVRFQYEAKKISGNVYEVRITAQIDQPWHIYSQFTPAEGPSLPTSISFSKNPLVELVGKPQEKGNLKIKHEKILDVQLKYYSGKVEFVQRIKLKTAVNTNLNGVIEYMVCTDERCLPPVEEKFSVELKK